MLLNALRVPILHSIVLHTSTFAQKAIMRNYVSVCQQEEGILCGRAGKTLITMSYFSLSSSISSLFFLPLVHLVTSVCQLVPLAGVSDPPPPPDSQTLFSWSGG